MVNHLVIPPSKAGNQVQMQLLEPETAKPRRVLIIVNPIAGRRQSRRLATILRRLDELKCEVTVRETKRRGDAELLVKAALPEDFAVIAAAGGDGTVNEVINGLAGSDQPFAILPLGTANVLAGEIGLDRYSNSMLAELIAYGKPSLVYFGLANGRYFTLMAGVGLDAQVVNRVNPRLKRWTGMFAYLVQSMIEILCYRPVLYTIHIGATTYQAASVIVAKSHYYGKRFTCAPQACLQDPLLHVCLFLRPGRWNALRYALALVRGRLDTLPDYYIISASSLTIFGREGDPVQLDGDIDACLPVAIQVAPHPFRLLNESGFRYPAPIKKLKAR